MVPSQQPRNPIGMVTRPGKLSEDGEPCESGPGQTGGLSAIITAEAMIPNVIPVSAPVVLKRRHSRASSSGGEVAPAGENKPHLPSTGTVKAGPRAPAPED